MKPAPAPIERIESPDDLRFDDLLARLEPLAGPMDRSGAWPAESLELYRQAGVLEWVVPREYGGLDWEDVEVAAGYERLARACLATVFVLTQRNGACRRIAGSGADELKAELLPRLAAGELFATVGISHLTTSRQHLAQPAVEAAEKGDAFVLNGSVPWVTGADHADTIVTGATLADQRQVLVALPTALEGVEVGEPARMIALDESHTGPVHLRDVVLPERWLLAGPLRNVMQSGQGAGTGGLETSALAIGLAGRAADSLAEYAEARPYLAEAAAALNREVAQVSDELRAIESGLTPSDAMAIRTRANSLVLRATQANLAAAKGAGFVADHPAGRWARQAMFFLVWSCPQPVVDSTLKTLLCQGSELGFD
jgi:alkylation response protein AidB-like acyl-CoA dehydrogenase